MSKSGSHQSACKNTMFSSNFAIILMQYFRNHQMASSHLPDSHPQFRRSNVFILSSLYEKTAKRILQIHRQPQPVIAQLNVQTLCFLQLGKIFIYFIMIHQMHHPLIKSNQTNTQTKLQKQHYEVSDQKEVRYVNEQTNY